MVSLRNLVGGVKHLERRMQHLSEIYDSIAEIVRREAISVTADYRSIRRSDPGTPGISILPLPTFYIWGFRDTPEGRKSALQWETHEKTTHYLSGRHVIDSPDIKSLGGTQSRVTSTKIEGSKLTILAGDVPGGHGEVSTMLVNGVEPKSAVLFVGGLILDVKGSICHGEYFRGSALHSNGIEYVATGFGGRRIVVRFPDGRGGASEQVRVSTSNAESTVLYRKVGELEFPLRKSPPH